VLLGAALRSVQYLSRTSLKGDEAALALNLASRSFRELFRPLDLAQGGPWGFLAIEKGLFGLFGRSELGLRLLPLLASLLALVLFERLCRRVLKGFAVPFAVAAFALGAGLIDYAAQLKQYATDVAAALAIVLLAVSFQEKRLTRRRGLLLGIAGLLACVVSQPVVFVLAGVGLSLVLLAVARKVEATTPALALAGSLWLLGAAFALWSGERMLTPGVKSYLQAFWASGFPPFSPPATAAWLWNQMAGIFYGFLGYPLPLLFVALLLAGGVGLSLRHRAAALFLLMPILLTLAASAARLYPFAPGRVTAFLVPGLLILAAEGVERARTFPSRGLSGIGTAVAAVAAACLLWGTARNPPPYMEEHVRPALERLRGQWRPGDALYVYYGARLPYLFYAPVLDLPAREATLGECARDNPRRYLADLDALRGRPRVWILLAHDLPQFAEGPLIFGYLDRIGRPLERMDFRSHGSFSAVVLAAWDLSEPARLSAATSDTYPVPDPPKEALPALPCAGTMGPIPGRLSAR